MVTTSCSESEVLIKNCIMKDKNYAFEFHQVNVGTVIRLLRSLLDDKIAGTDHLGSKPCMFLYQFVIFSIDV